MGSLLVWVASALVAGSLPVAWWALTDDRASRHAAGRNLAGLSPTLREYQLQRSPLERFTLPMLRYVGARLLRFTPIGWVENRTRAVARAGMVGRITPEQVLGGKLVTAVVLLGLTVLQIMGDAGARTVGLFLLMTVVGFFLPDLLLRSVGDRRSDAIVLALPDLLDQVTVSVEAGLGFEPSLARACRDRTDPLAQELIRTLQDIRLGSTRGDALEALAGRSQVDDLRTVVLALRQADALGVPLADSLRTLSGDMREKRRYRAEARAQRLPTLMIFPLGLCILPALFIMVLAPSIVTSGGSPFP